MLLYEWISEGRKEVAIQIIHTFGAKEIGGGVEILSKSGASGLAGVADVAISNDFAGGESPTTSISGASGDDESDVSVIYDSDVELNKASQDEQRELNREARRAARIEERVVDQEVETRKRVADLEASSTSKKKSKRRQSYNEIYEKKKAINSKLGFKMSELMKLWRCGYASCPINNQEGWCWTPEGREHRHYAIKTDLLKAWKEDIVNRRATTKKPSLEWKQKIFTYHDAVHSKQKTLRKMLANLDPTTTTAAAPIQSPQPIIICPPAPIPSYGPQQPVQPPQMYPQAYPQQPQSYWSGPQANMGLYTQYPSADQGHSQVQLGTPGASLFPDLGHPLVQILRWRVHLYELKEALGRYCLRILHGRKNAILAKNSSLMRRISNSRMMHVH